MKTEKQLQGEIDALKREMLERDASAAVAKLGLDEPHARAAVKCLIAEGRIAIDDAGKTHFVDDGAAVDLDQGVQRWSQTDDGRIFTGRTLLDDVRGREMHIAAGGNSREAFRQTIRKFFDDNGIE